MAREIVLPQWGMEMQDATIVKWLKQEGDSIQEGEPLVEVETAKIETEMESTASGVLAHILVPEGATVPIRTVLAIVAAPGEQVPRPALATSAVTPIPATTGRPSLEWPSHPGVKGLPRSCQRPVVWPRSGGIDLSQFQGTGPGGRILLEDVQRAIDARTAAPAAPAGVAVQVTPVARRLAQQHGIDLGQVHGTGPRGQNPGRRCGKAIAAQVQPAGPSRHRWCPSGVYARPSLRACCRACRPWPRSP